ncbi:MAG TPA: Crp/Fnr family transcriptional regulator [Sphingomicrobium sp.]|nr:Crp/Fnr family transcriptional regulator [Sphingomicrobium sp.]
MRSPLSPEEQRAVLRLEGKPANIPARHDIVSPGETVIHACLVARGVAARFDQMRDGQRQIASFHLPGDMCDLHSVVAPTAAWGIAALNATTVLFIPHRELRELAQAYPGIAFAFWRESTVDGSILAKWVGNLGRQDARARIAHILCEFGLRSELAGLGTRSLFTLGLTQEQLADAAGLTAVHVNRTLQSLRASGLVATRGHAVEVPDWQRLADVAEFDPSYLLLGPAGSGAKVAARLGPGEAAEARAPDRPSAAEHA